MHLVPAILAGEAQYTTWYIAEVWRQNDHVIVARHISVLLLLQGAAVSQTISLGTKR